MSKRTKRKCPNGDSRMRTLALAVKAALEQELTEKTPPQERLLKSALATQTSQCVICTPSPWSYSNYAWAEWFALSNWSKANLVSLHQSNVCK